MTKLEKCECRRIWTVRTSITVIILTTLMGGCTGSEDIVGSPLFCEPNPCESWQTCNEELTACEDIPEPAFCKQSQNLRIQSHSGYGIHVSPSLGTCPTLWYPNAGHESCQWTAFDHDMHFPFTATVTVEQCIPTEATFLMMGEGISEGEGTTRLNGARCNGNGVPFELHYIPEEHGCVSH